MLPFLLLLINVLNAVDLDKKPPIEFQFRPVHPVLFNDGKRHEKHMQVANITVGTPGQIVQVSLQELNTDGNFRFLTTFKPGRFLPNNSTTFERIGESEKDYFGDSEGYIGTDVIQTGNQFISGKPILIYTKSVDYTYADLHLSPLRGDPKHHFMHSLLQAYKEKIAVITFDKTKKSSDIPGLKLTIGSKPKHLCKADWRYLPVEDSHPLEGFPGSFPWMVKMDSIHVNDRPIKHSTPMLVNFGLTGFWGMMWQKEGKQLILSELSENARDGRVPCSINKEIVFKVGGFDFRFKPKDYLDPYPKNIVKNRCLLRQDYTNNYYAIPYWFLYDKCLLLDYEKRQIGLASRI